MFMTGIVLPLWGWNSVFVIFGVLSLCSLSLLFVFENKIYFPMAHDRPLYERKDSKQSSKSSFFKMNAKK